MRSSRVQEDARNLHEALCDSVCAVSVLLDASVCATLSSASLRVMCDNLHNVRCRLATAVAVLTSISLCGRVKSVDGELSMGTRDGPNGYIVNEGL